MNGLDRLPAPAPEELLVVVGPTASGKTGLAMRLANAHHGEIVGADSVQIYRHFDIGSGKPAPEQLAEVRHHLVDCVEPLDAFDAAQFVREADRAVADIRRRGNLPIICGGTFLWVKALLFGLAPAPPADAAIRQRHREWAERSGREALHARLAEVDPTSAERLAPQDFVRVSRALEVHELSGQPLSHWHEEHRFREIHHRAKLIGIHRSSAELDQRIHERTAAWLASGWVEEVAGLLADGLGECRAMSSVGYRQVRDHLQGALRHEELHEQIVRVTRRFVRRQRTWLRDQPVHWTEP